MPELTESHASEIVESLLRNAIATLPRPPRLKSLRAGAHPCTDPVTDEYESTVTVGRGYWLLGLDPKRATVYVEALRVHWLANGFLITADTRPQNRFVAVEQEDSGFRMSVTVSDTGVLAISASSPCVAPDNHPDR